jgi:hypothetical protein
VVIVAEWLDGSFESQNRLYIKSVKIYAIPYIFSTTLLLYKLDTLLLKQKKRPVFGFHLSTHAEKEICYILFLILVLHLRQFFIVRIFVKRATGI